MKSIVFTDFKSSDLTPEFNSIKSIQVDDKPFDRGAFGEVYFCSTINQTLSASTQVVKVFIDDGSGSSLRGHNTIIKLQEKIIEQNISLIKNKEKPIQDINSLFALPQFSFEGTLSGKKVRGYSANYLPKSDWLLFSQIFNEENLTKRKYLRNTFYNLPLDHRLKMAYDLVEGFSQLEQMSFIYADLNPKNFFVSQARGNACLIDYEGGAVNDNPETFGKPGEWLAPEIQNQLLQNNSTFIKVDLNTDTWAVAIAIHFILFNFHPLFFLKTRGSREMNEYFRDNSWPDINKQNYNYRQEVNSAYDRYINKLQTQIPKALVNAFAETINNGFTNPNKRLSYRQWLRIIEGLIGQQSITPIRLNSTIQNLHAPSGPTLSSGSTYQRVSMGSAIPGRVQNPKWVESIFGTRNIGYYASAAAILLVVVYLLVVTSRDISSTGSVNPVALIVPVKIDAFNLKFRDAESNEIKPVNGRLKKSDVRQVHTQVVVNDIPPGPFTVSLKIMGPTGKMISIPNLSPIGFTFSKQIDIDASYVNKEIDLQDFVLNCPGCASGSYKFEIYVDSTFVLDQSVEIY